MSDYTFDKVAFGKRLREIREKRHLYRNSVAEITGIGSNSLYCWEKGKFMPSVWYLPVLAELYNCSIDDFFYDAEDYFYGEEEDET